jgi:hypothetical protein
MSVCRLIFRLDFDVNYDIIDHPGGVMKLIDQAGDSYWSEMTENQRRRGLAGKYISDDGEMANEFIVEPKAIIASFELVDGVDLKKIVDEKSFLLLAKLTDSMCEKFHINEIRRSGIRVFHFDNLQRDRKPLSVSKTFFDDDLTGGVESVLGEIQDCGVSFDGASEEGVKYHCRIGPLKEDEDYAKYFENIGPKFGELSNWDFVVDIDLYEQDIAISKTPMRKWFRPQIEKATKLINFVGSEFEKN